jgi:hypothetical protein
LGRTSFFEEAELTLWTSCEAEVTIPGTESVSKANKEREGREREREVARRREIEK